MLETLLKAEPQPLYIQRKLANPLPFIEWAKSQGFPKVLSPEELHVTVVYSKQAVDWDALAPAEDTVSVAGGPRSVIPLGTEGAVVLKFDSQDLQERHSEWETTGASWDYDEYHCHVTISYFAADVDLASVKPYTGVLEFGPEIYEPINENYKETVVEKVEPAQSIAGFASVFKGHPLVTKDDLVAADIATTGLIEPQPPKKYRRLSLAWLLQSSDSVQKGAPYGNRNAAKDHKAGQLGTGTPHARDPDKTYDGRDIPKHSVAEVADGIADLRAKGIKVQLTAADLHAMTLGRVHPVELVKSIWGVDEYDNGNVKNAKIDINRDSGELQGSLLITGHGGKVHGSAVNYIERNFLPGMQAVDHTYLKLADEDTANGAIKKMFTELVPVYKKMGIKEIRTHANLEAGAYAWSKYGFAADHPPHVKQMVDEGWANLIKHANEGVPKEDRPKLSTAATAEMDGLRDILANGGKYAATALAMFPTPHLDAHFGHVYAKAKDRRIPDTIPMTFVKTIMSGKHWTATHSFDDPRSAKQLEDYLTSKKPKKA